MPQLNCGVEECYISANGQVSLFICQWGICIFYLWVSEWKVYFQIDSYKYIHSHQFYFDAKFDSDFNKCHSPFSHQIMLIYMNKNLKLLNHLASEFHHS